MRNYLIVGAVLLAALSGVAVWIEGAGYRRAMEECRAGAAEQEKRLLTLRHEIETRWMREADSVSMQKKELDDGVAAVDRAVGSAAVCLDGDGLLALKAIR